jgi:hypothetical protein
VTTSVVWFNNGDGTFGTGNVLPANPAIKAVGDLNLDGLLDLAGAASIRLNNGDGTFSNSVVTALGNITDITGVADLNRDGKLDLVERKLTGVTTWLNQTPSPTPLAFVTGGPFLIAWPNWPGFLLESTTNLALANGWSPVTNTPVLINSQKVVTNWFQGNGSYYRLRKLP